MVILTQNAIKRFKYFQKHFPNSKFKVKALGNPILNAVFKIWPESAPAQQFVVKQYSTFLNTIKWIGLRFFTFLGIKYDINEVLRIQNEINGLKWCQKHSIQTPRLYDTHKTRVVMDFIEGVPLDEFSVLSTPELVNAYQQFGVMLAKIHAKGSSIGDCKAENVMLNRETKELYLLDLEQFKQTDDVQRHAWDVNEFVFYLGHYFPRKHSRQLLGIIIKSFLSKYFEAFADLSNDQTRLENIKRNLGKFHLSWVYLLFMSPLTFRFIYKILNEWKNSVRNTKA